MKYRIKISYETGDSFHKEDIEDYIDGDWNDIDVVKDNLQRIKEHYKQHEEVNTYFNKGRSIDDIYKDNKDKEWFVYMPKLYHVDDYAIDEKDKKKLENDQWLYKPDKYFAENCLILKMDNGNNYQLSAFWCGYFETLYSVEVEIDKSDLKIEF